MTAWKPMSTAPRDGTEFLLCYAHRCIKSPMVTVAFWENRFTGKRFKTEAWRESPNTERNLILIGWQPPPTLPTEDEISGLMSAS